MWLLIKMGLNRTCLAVAFSIRIFLVACGGGMNVFYMVKNIFAGF